MNKFINGMEHEESLTLTTNGATAYNTTGDYLVDAISTLGAMRNSKDVEVENKFIKAFSEDKLLATKLAFYLRNVRGLGCGERKIFRTIMNYLGNNYPEIVNKNLDNFDYYGRFDDLFCLFGTKSENSMLEYAEKRFNEDIDTEFPTLALKWFKSINTSSSEARATAKKIAKHLNLTHKEYRKALAKVRSRINIVEKLMSENKWTEIEYSKVPSRAMSIYRRAFEKHDEKGFTNYVDSLVKGETKVNASTLFPYDLMKKMQLDIGGNSRLLNPEPILLEQWKALPNYIEGENNVLVMADTSGSMSGRPMMTSVGLALYFAERNKGIFKDVFMTFSENPQFVRLVGNTLPEKVRCIRSIVENTNLYKAFGMILDVCIKNKVPQSEVPKSLIVITDMQFDSMTSRNDETIYEVFKSKFEDVGYIMPNVIYWDVSENSNSTHQTKSQVKNVQMYSGQSASMFQAILANIGKTPYQAMLDTLNNEIFDRVII
jgi:hypothetical protein